MQSLINCMLYPWQVFKTMYALCQIVKLILFFHFCSYQLVTSFDKQHCLFCLLVSIICHHHSSIWLIITSSTVLFAIGRNQFEVGTWTWNNWHLLLTGYIVWPWTETGQVCKAAAGSVVKPQIPSGQIQMT